MRKVSPRSHARLPEARTTSEPHHDHPSISQPRSILRTKSVAPRRPRRPASCATGAAAIPPLLARRRRPRPRAPQPGDRQGPDGARPGRVRPARSERRGGGSARCPDERRHPQASGVAQGRERDLRGPPARHRPARRARAPLGAPGGGGRIVSAGGHARGQRTRSGPAASSARRSSSVGARAVGRSSVFATSSMIPRRSGPYGSY